VCLHKNKSNFFSIKQEVSVVVLSPPHLSIKHGIIKAQKHPKETLATKIWFKKLDFLA
jgi:hypothetical protein